MNHARWRAENYFYCRRCKTDTNIGKYKNTLHMELGHYFILLHQKTKAKISAEASNSHNILWPLVNTPGRPLYPLELFKMDQVENVEALSLEYHKVEELFEYRDAEVFEPFFLSGPIDTVKHKLKLLKDEGTDIHNFYQSYF